MAYKMFLRSNQGRCRLVLNLGHHASNSKATTQARVCLNVTQSQFFTDPLNESYFNAEQFNKQFNEQMIHILK